MLNQTALRQAMCLVTCRAVYLSTIALMEAIAEVSPEIGKHIVQAAAVAHAFQHTALHAVPLSANCLLCNIPQCALTGTSATRLHCVDAVMPHKHTGCKGLATLTLTLTCQLLSRLAVTFTALEAVSCIQSQGIWLQSKLRSWRNAKH